MNLNNIKDIGYHFSYGSVRCIAEVVLLSALVIFILAIIWGFYGIGVDDSDESAWHRSNLTIYTDAKTGVQYVGTKHGLTVRIDQAGNPVVRKEDETL